MCLKNIGKVLNDLRKKRNSSDYDVNYKEIDYKYVHKLGLTTKESLETLDYLIKNPPIHYTNKNQ